MSDQGFFTVGPPEPVLDSRLVGQAVTPEDEARFVHGEDLGDDHPDNVTTESDSSDVDEVPPQTEDGDEEDLPGEDELSDLVAAVDPDDVDEVGFDEADLEEPGGS
jgi:hypothetical protein